MVYLPRLYKSIRRSINILSAKPEQFEILKRNNIETLKSKLTGPQLKNVEFLADKVFELSAEELTFVLKELSMKYETREHMGSIGYDQNIAQALSESLLIRPIRDLFEPRKGVRTAYGYGRV